MGKYAVTAELSETIRDLRLKNNISSKAVAEHLNKSQSYMTKLEKREIKSIEEKDLTSLFQLLLGNEENFDKVLEDILSALHLRYTDEKVDAQLWFANYDTVVRLIPIPDTLVDDFNVRMKTLDLSIDALCGQINGNEGLPSDIDNPDLYEFNKWQACMRDGEVKSIFIKMRVDPITVQKILNKTCASTNYVTILAMEHYLRKIETYGALQQISDVDEKQLGSVVTDYLNEHKFFSIAEKRKLSTQAETPEEKNNILSSFDKENQTRMTSIIKAFEFYSDFDLLQANKTLSTFEKNLKWDISFMMTLLKLPLHTMEKMTFATKKNMLTELRDVVRKYQNLPKEDTQLETYD